MATTSITINGQEIDVTDCGRANCGEPPVEPRPPKGYPFSFGIPTKAERDAERAYREARSKWQEAMARYHQCINNTCKDAAVVAQESGKTEAPVVTALQPAPKPESPNSKPPTIGGMTTTDDQGRSTTTEEAKDYTKYIIIGAAVLIAGFIGYKLLKKK